MEKKYKLKEEVKKYVDDDYHFRKGTLEWWENNCFTLEALEEVNERIEVFIEDKKESFFTNSLKKTHKDWTEQERELIEFVVNEWKDKLDFIVSLDTFGTYAYNQGRVNKQCSCITDWLKQRKH